MEYPQRKRTRLKDFDYGSNGYYFVTICTHNRKDLFWEDDNTLSHYGKIAKEELLKIEQHYQNVKIDKFAVMPNHIHAIIIITERINPFPTNIKYDLPNIIGKYKAAVTRRVGKAFMPSAKVVLWQNSFYDHIIRGQNNPAKWEEDCFFS